MNSGAGRVGGSPSKVSLVRCHDYGTAKVYEAVRSSVELLGGGSAFVSPGEKILIKPNLLSGKAPERAVTTHPHVVGAVIRLVKEWGGVPFVGDSPAIGGAAAVAKRCGILDICEKEGAEFKDLKTLVDIEYPEGRHFKRLQVAREALECDGIINIPKLKTHAQMYLTLAVKNLFGCVPGKLKPQWHLTAGIKSTHFAEMLLDLYNFLSPRLNILDGIVGMEGNGPGNGTPVEIGLIAASKGGLELDKTVARIVGADPGKVPTLSASEGDEVQVLGPPLEELLVKDFTLPPQISTDFADILPDFIGKRLRKSLTSRPKVTDSTCTLCSHCVDICPKDVMTKGESIDIDYDGCIRCYCCQEVCPEGAIAPKSGLLKSIIPGL